MLEFMYLGETTVAEEDIQKLLTAAKELEITDLHQNELNKVEQQIGKKRKLTCGVSEEVSDGSGVSLDQSIQGFLGEMRNSSCETENLSHDYSSQEQEDLNSQFNFPPVVEAATSSQDSTWGVEVPQIQKSFSCTEPGCEAVLPKYSAYMKHLKNEHNISRILYCKYCDYQAGVRSQIKQHIRIKHPGETFDCRECEFKGTTKSELQRHIVIHYKNVNANSKRKNSQFKCDKCNFKTKEESLFISHRYVHIAANV